MLVVVAHRGLLLAFEHFCDFLSPPALPGMCFLPQVGRCQTCIDLIFSMLQGSGTRDGFAVDSCLVQYLLLSSLLTDRRPRKQQVTLIVQPHPSPVLFAGQELVGMFRFFGFGSPLI